MPRGVVWELGASTGAPKALSRDFLATLTALLQKRISRSVSRIWELQHRTPAKGSGPVGISFFHFPEKGDFDPRFFPGHDLPGMELNEIRVLIIKPAPFAPQEGARLTQDVG